MSASFHLRRDFTYAVILYSARSVSLSTPLLLTAHSVGYYIPPVPVFSLTERVLSAFKNRYQ